MCRWKKKSRAVGLAGEKHIELQPFVRRQHNSVKKKSESAVCICMYQFQKWSELLQECMKFYTMKCKGTGWVWWLPYSSFPVRSGWATGWPVLCSKKENWHQSNISLFYWNTHIRDNSLEKFNEDWTSNKLDTKSLQCWTLWKQNFILTSLVPFCLLRFPPLPFS